MTIDVEMIDGENAALIHAALGVEGASGSSPHVCVDSPPSALHFPSPYGSGGSPTKYISPRLRGSVSPLSLDTLPIKRSLAADAAPNWRSNLLFGATPTADATIPAVSSPNLSLLTEVLGSFGPSRVSSGMYLTILS
ncbi:unnamed protein product [Calypogeia fissa]